MSTVEDAEKRLARGQAVDEAYQALEKYQVDQRRIVFVDEEHKRAGGYGVVRQAHLHASAYIPTWFASRRYGAPQVVAVKEIKMSSIYSLHELKRAFTKEMLVWSGVEGHPGVARFLGFCTNFKHSEAWLISPWEPYGNVSDFIRGRQLEVPEKLSLVYDTIDALTFLHQSSPPVCHGDIKSANVLVNSQHRAVLCDFGLARLFEDNGFGRLETSTGFKGSIRWCSPELLEGHPRTPNSDVYAWAWLVWEIMTGELPYEGAGADYIIIRKIFESPRPQVDGESRLSDCLQVWELMTRCWVAAPLQRPTSAMCKTTIAYLPHCPPSSATNDPHTRSAALLENLGELESWKGNRKEGFSYLEQALLLYEEEGNDKGVASVLRKQAAAAHYDSDHVKALNAASAALEKFRSLNDASGAADALYWMGSALLLASKNEAALPNLLEGLEISRAEGNTVGVINCLERLGEAYRRGGRTSEALAALEEAVDIASRCGDRLGEAKALTILGVTYYFGLSDNTRAISNYSKALNIARDIGWEHGVTTALCRIGAIKFDEGIYPEAEGLLRESVRVARRSDAKWRLGQALYYLGRCLWSQDMPQEAISTLEDSCTAYEGLALDYSSALGDGAAYLAGLKASQGDTEGALFWYDKAIAESRKGPDKFEVSKYLEGKGECLVKVGRFDEGALHLEASLVLAQELGMDAYVDWRRSRLGSIPKTVIKWDVRRQARLRSAKTHPARTASISCDMKKLQRRVPQLTTANLKLTVHISNGGDS